MFCFAFDYNIFVFAITMTLQKKKKFRYFYHTLYFNALLDNRYIFNKCDYYLIALIHSRLCIRVILPGLFLCNARSWAMHCCGVACRRSDGHHALELKPCYQLSVFSAVSLSLSPGDRRPSRRSLIFLMLKLQRRYPEIQS